MYNSRQVYVLGKTKQKKQRWKLQALVSSGLKEASLSCVPEIRASHLPVVDSAVVLQGGCQEDGPDFSVVPSNRTRGNGHKLEHRKFCLNIMKKLFTWRVAEHWHRLPREVVQSPSLEILKTHLDAFLCNLRWVTLLWQGGWLR